jgi:hypothetical protein
MHHLCLTMVENKLRPYTDKDVIELEFRHNAYESQSDKLYEGFVCFDLRPLRVMNSDSVMISVKVKEWTDKTYSDTREKIFLLPVKHQLICKYLIEQSDQCLD